MEGGNELKIVSVGDNVIDFYEDLNKGHPGGNAVNVSVFMKRLGAEKSKYIGIVGNDRNGETIKKSLENESVDIEGIRTAIGETGLTSVIIDKKGDRIFNSWNGGGVQSQLKLNFTKDEIQTFKSYDLLHTSVYSYLENDLRYISNYTDISFDFSTEYGERRIRKVCPHVDYAFFSASDLSNEEIKLLFELAHSLGTKHVIITMGEKGAIMSVDGEKTYQKAYQTKVVDTLGAGDSFIAALLYNMFRTSDIHLSLDKASKFAAKTCGYYGAF